MKPDDGYIAYIVNPKSGATGSKMMGQSFERYLSKKGFEVRAFPTNSLTHARQLACEVGADKSCGLVIAAGGDGTIREIAHGLEGCDKPMMIIPCGTENLLANELGYDERLSTMIKAFESGQIKPVDLGNINGRCFTSIAGFGFDGEVVKLVSDHRTGHINHLDYIWPLWRTFWHYQFQSVNVKVDGQEIYNGPGLVFVGNISRYSIGLQILHNADFGDGLLDICIYKCRSKPHLIKHSIMTVLKHHSKCRDVIYRQGKNVIISSENKDVITEIDGDPGPSLPVKINVIPHAIKCLVPAGAKPAGIRTRIVRAIG
jgi:diacylglycerol kinase (ATP)